MTNDEARTLARRIIDTWPTGAKGYVWQEILNPLDAGRATDAYRQLITESTTKPPSPGQLLAAHHAHGERPTERRHGPVYDPADGPIMSRDEYLGRLEQRALRGDTYAAQELETWRKHIARGGFTPAETVAPAGQTEAF